MGTDNKRVIWGWAAAAGVLAFLILKFLMSYGFWPALFLAVLIAILVAILIWIGFYRDQEEETAAAVPAPAEPAKIAETSAAPRTEPAAAPAPKPEPKSQKPASAPAAALKPAASAAPAPQDAPAPAPAAGLVSATPSGDGPQTLSGPEGEADDLKRIKGVGPGLENTLNGLGFYHFRQIAAWNASDIEWVDQRLTFKGRIARDNWVDQAKTLAGGGDTEFSQRVDKGDMY